MPGATVHPRVGGEQGDFPDGGLQKVGSSPRGRGTGKTPLKAIALQRFIPAWAGNRRRPPQGPGRRSVHPRVGGEQPETCTCMKSRSGSSPRGRGTDNPQPGHPKARRFIPAWAGNRCPSRCDIRCRPVHPRVGGEQLIPGQQVGDVVGSSPRGRGTDVEPHDPVILGRFIPAWAGNSRMISRTVRPHAVHPRVGGEQPGRRLGRAGQPGSSPRGRGTGV